MESVFNRHNNALLRQFHIKTKVDECWVISSDVDWTDALLIVSVGIGRPGLFAYKKQEKSILIDCLHMWSP